MTDYIIPGFTPDAINKTNSEAKTSRRDFPVNPHKYTRFTGAVESVSIKMLGEDEKLSIFARNGECLAEILIDLDVRKRGLDSKKDTEVEMQEKLSRLLLAAKVLGISNAAGTGISGDKFGQAKGRLLAFSGKQTGTRVWEGRTFPKTSYFLDGEAHELVTVAPWGDDAAALVFSGTSTPAPAPSTGAFDCPF